MFPWWNKGWNRNAIAGPGGMENSIIGKGQTLLAVGWKGHLCSYQWRASHLLEQMLGYWWVSSETAAVHLRGSPLHDGLVHSVLHRQHLHYLLPVPLDETLHQAEWKALGSSPTWEKQVRSGYLFWSDDLRYGCNPLWTKDSISISLQMQPHQCCSWNWMQCWSMLMALSCNAVRAPAIPTLDTSEHPRVALLGWCYLPGLPAVSLGYWQVVEREQEKAAGSQVLCFSIGSPTGWIPSGIDFCLAWRSDQLEHIRVERRLLSLSHREMPRGVAIVMQ